MQNQSPSKTTPGNKSTAIPTSMVFKIIIVGETGNQIN